MSLIANSDSFELIVSSDAVSTIAALIRRSSKVGVVGIVVHDVVDVSGISC